jgi:hypothetical protein
MRSRAANWRLPRKGPRAELLALVPRLRLFPLLAACALPLVLTLAACATTSSGKQDLLAFLEHDPVTKQDALAHLGTASACFEKDRVLSFRLHRDAGGYLVEPVGTHDTGWEGVNYDLVLVFDTDGVLQRHNLVAIRPSNR